MGARSGAALIPVLGMALGLVLGLSSPVAAEQQLHTATTVADTYIEEAYPDSDPLDNNNYGTSTELRVDSGQRHRTLVRFDDFDPTVPAGSTATFISAYLELTISSSYVADFLNGADLALHTVTEAWTETGATWNCPDDPYANTGSTYPGCYFTTGPWGTEGINGYGGGAYDPVAVDVQTITDFDTVVQFDVTAEVQSFLDGGVNNGWMVRLADESSADQFRFPSREAASGQPNLVLVYEVVADTIAPVIRHLEPLDGGFEVRGPRPDLTVEISDGGTGLAGDLAILLDGVDITATCVESVPEVPPGGGGSGDPGDGGALVSVTGEPAPGATITNVSAAAKVGTFLYTCTPTSDLAAGAHTLDVSISDLAGNVGSSNGTFVLLLGPGPHVRQLTAAEDATLLAESTTENRGSDLTLEVQDTPVHRALVDFDLFAFEELVGKTTVSFDDASLELFAEGTADLPGPLTVGAYRLLQDWRESNVVWSCARDLSPEGECPQPWTGGNATTTAEDTLTVDSATTGALSWTVTNDLSGGLLPAGSPQHPLFGWLLRFDPETGAPASATPPVATFTSREGAPAQAPTLTVTFTTPLLGDETPPDVVFVQPPSVTTNTSPPVSLAFTDDQSGVDAASFVLTLDGADITANCTVTATGADCTTPVLTEASHTLVATLADLAGNGGSHSLTFDVSLSTDDTAPNVAVVAPIDDPVTTSQVPVEVVYSDDQSLALATLQVMVDMIDLTPSCTVAADRATCPTPPLGEGVHTVEASIADSSGNVGSGARSFEVVLDVVDGDPPSLTISAPVEGAILTDVTQPSVDLQFSDADSGVDQSSVRVSVDGSDFSAGCTVTATTATCVPPELGQGQHTVSARVADLVGNEATDTVTFEIQLTASDPDPPVITVLSPPASVVDDRSPTISFEVSDGGVGVDFLSVGVTLDGVDITGACAADASPVTCSTSGLLFGPHTLVLEASDLAGNQATLQHDFDIVSSSSDQTPPTLSFTSPGAQVVEGDLLTVDLTVSDLDSGIDPTTPVVRLDGVDITAACVSGTGMLSCPQPSPALGMHTLSAEVRDLAGNLATQTAGFEVIAEGLAPEIDLVDPAGPVVRGTTSPTLSIAYSDAVSGVDLGTLQVLLDQADITGTCSVGPQSATCPTPVLSPGEHEVSLQLADLRGNLATSIETFEIVLDLEVSVASPASGTVTTASTVDVSGLVSVEAESVRVAGVDASLDAGTFSATGVPLREGTNTLTVVARTAAGGIGSATVSVVRDTTVPQVAITSPPDGFVTTSSQLLVTGEYNEPASSGSEVAEAVVTVNGVAAQVENRTFFLPAHLLQPGENRIRVETEDGAGNVGSAEVTVTLLTDPTQKIEELLGNAQTGTVGQTLAKPLVVRVTDGIGNPLSERLVRFEVSRGDGFVRIGTEEARSLTVRTDDLGRAQVDFTLGERAGMGNHEVTVTSVGFPGSLVFCASAEPLPADRIVRIQGNHQTAVLAGAVGEELPKPLFTQVFDAMDNAVAGVPVTYEVVTGGGSFGGQPTFTATTDANGVAAATFTLGPLPGVDVHVVKASFPGSTGGPAVFNVTGLEPGPEAQTSVSGIVLDNQDQPVPNATMSIVGTQLSTLTDAEGRFQIVGVPVGTVHLKADGTTVTLPGNWAVLEFEMVTVSGQDNGLGTPVRLLPIDAGVLAGGDEDVVIPLDGVPGATLTVFANSATFPDGSKEGLVSFTQVHNDKVPMVPPLGSTFAIALTIQPAGTLFDPPAQIQIPNPGHKLGEVVDIYSFDHDLGEFVPAGTGSVTPDGQFLRSNPGFGVRKAGWHGCVRPVPETDACNPGACSVCTDNGPVSQCGECEVCGGGAPSLFAGADGALQNLGAAAVSCMPKTLEGVEIMARGEKDELLVPTAEAVTFSADVKGSCSPRVYNWTVTGSGGQAFPPSTLASPSYTFDTPGVYTVTVEVSCQDCSGVSPVSDTFQVIAFEAEIEEPTGDPVSSPSFKNEFTFSAADPGILVVTVKAKVTPTEAIQKVSPHIRWRISKPQAAGSMLEWPNGQWPSDPLAGRGLGNYAKITGLFASNQDFGRRTITMEVLLDDENVDVTDTTDIEVFYFAHAQNHPGTRNVPNWFNYYQQVEGGTDYVFDGTDSSRATPGVPNSIKIGNEVITGQSYLLTSIVNGQLKLSDPLGSAPNMGLATFLAVLTHERSHVNNEVTRSLWGSAVDPDADGLPSYFETSTSQTDPGDGFSATAPIELALDSEVYAGGPVEEAAFFSSQSIAVQSDWSDPGTNHGQ